MSGFPENQLAELISETGIRLLQPPNSIPELLNLLDEVEFLLTKLGQAPSQLVQKALLIPMKALIADELLGHSDPDVRITIASCLNEVIRITAPIPPYEDDKMREIFELIVSSFEYLSCQFGRCYSKAVVILQSVARLRACVMMLDLDCDPLVTKMFELFQRNISPKHPQSVVLAMVKIMSLMIEECDNVSTELVKVLLTSIRRENQSVSPASWELSAKILERCTDKLRPYILETVSSMGYCLEDYAPILLSICKPEPEPKPITVMNVTNDSPVLVNNEPSGNLSHRAPYVQALEAVRTVDYHNAYGSGGTALTKRRKQHSQNLVEEPTDLHLVNDKPSGNLCHQPDYVQALEATESCQMAVIGEAEYVQALEAAESLCVNASETEGTTSKEEKKSKFLNLDEEAIGLDCEHDHQSTADGDGSKNNEIVKKEMDFKSVQEEADGFENKQVYDSCVLGANKRKRGRARKKDVERQETSGGSVNMDAFQSNDPFQNQRKSASLDEEVNIKPPGNLSHSAESVQDLKAAESVQCVDALSTEGTVSKEGKSLKSQSLDEEVTGLECEQGHQGTADDGISENSGILRTDMDLERVEEEPVSFDNKQLYNSSSVLGDNKRKRGRPRKKDVKQQEVSGGSGNKSETGLFMENDALSTGGTVSKEGRSLKSQSLDEEVTGLECEQGHQGTADDGIGENSGILRTDIDLERVKGKAVGLDNKQLYNSSVLGDNKRKRGRPRKKDAQQQEVSGGSGNKSETGPSMENDALSTGGTVSKEGRSLKTQDLDEEVTCLECEPGRQGTADDGISKNNRILRTDMDLEKVEEEAVGFNDKQLYNSSALGDNKRKRGRPRKKDVKQQEFSGGSENKSKTGPSTKDKFQSNGCFHNERNRASSDDDVIETPLGRKNYKDLVGCRIKVWWPLDGRYYKGRITLFDASMKKHQVAYEDGDEEILNLKKERWEFI